MNTRPFLHYAVWRMAMAALWGVLAISARPAAAGSPATPATGRIQYRVNSPMVNGAMTMAWVEHGKKTRQDMKLSVGGGGQHASIDSWSVSDGPYVYTYQPGMGKQVMRMRLSRASQASATLGGIPGVGAVASGRVVGKGAVLGHPCEIRVLGGRSGSGRGKVWLWNGMALKVETSGPGGGGMTMVATKVETAPNLSPASFRVPAGYRIKDVQLPTGAQRGAPGGPR